MNEILTLKEWLEKEGIHHSIAQGISLEIIVQRAIFQDLLERYANYKNQMLEAKILEFRQKFELHPNYDDCGDNLTDFIVEEYDKHFNIKQQTI